MQKNVATLIREIAKHTPEVMSYYCVLDMMPNGSVHFVTVHVNNTCTVQCTCT